MYVGEISRSQRKGGDFTGGVQIQWVVEQRRAESTLFEI